MKQPTELSQTYPQFSKPTLIVDPSSNSANLSSFFASAFYYEPTSVLDTHLTSSPAASASNANANTNAAATATASTDLPPLPWADGGGGGDDHHDLHLLPPSSDEWDPFAWFLSEKEDLDSFSKKQVPLHEDTNVSSFDDSPFELTLFDPFSSDHVPSPPSAAAMAVNFDRSHLDSLVRAAQCFETNDFASAHMILSRLNQNLSSPVGSPRQRSAFHFKEALLSLLRPSTTSPESPLSSAELVRRIAAQKAFSELSPVPHFATFTATQTLLEAFDAVGAAGSIHLIDFEFGLGCQWSSFAQDLVTRSRSARSPPPTVRITAVVVDETTETALAAENLRDFARGIGLRLAVEFVRVSGVGTLAFGGIRLGGAIEPVGVVLSTAIFRLLDASGAPETAAATFRFVRRASPRVVMFVDTEFGACSGNSPSLSQSVAAGVEFYAALLESLEAAAAVATTGAGEEMVRRVELTAIRPRVLSLAGGWAGLFGPWRQVLRGAGWSPVHFSEFAESQAEWLVRQAPVGGYHVARRDGALVLSWNGTDLAATSAWSC